LLVEPNLVSAALASKEAGELTPDDEHTLIWATSSMFGGGSETTVSSITSFMLCMALHPSTQKRAQEQIDTVTGGTRLPSLTDVSNLPYVQCVVREVMRWNPVFPTGNMQLNLFFCCFHSDI
jgi:cytochrome P450